MVLTVFVLVVTAGGSPLVGAEMSPNVDSAPEGTDSDPQQNTPATGGNNTTSTAGNETTPRDELAEHVHHPEESSGGDGATINDKLSAGLWGRLDRSLTAAEKGNYASSLRIVGAEYNETVRKYDSIGGNATPQFSAAGRSQRRFVRNVRNFWRTYAEYRAAQQDGNDPRSSRLARRLDRRAQNVSESADELKRDYGAVAAVTGINASAIQKRVSQIQRRVLSTQRKVRSAEFTPTEMTVNATDTDISHADPLRVTGRIQTANGSSLANDRVTIRIAGQTKRVQTDGDGEFTLVYRPTTLPLNTSSLTVRYVPNDTSQYHGSSGTIEVAVSQVQSTVSIERDPDSVEYADVVVVRGQVSAGDEPAADVPVVVRLGDTVLGTVQTDDSGRYELRRPLPASVRPGNRTLSATVPLREQALSGARNTTTQRVIATGTELNASARQISAKRLHVTGRLTTTGIEGSRQGIANRTVNVRIEGTTVQTVRTDEDGGFQTSLTVPSDALPSQRNGTVELTLLYEGRGLNLNSSQERLRVRLESLDPQGTSTDPWAGRFSNMIPLVGVPLLVLLASAVVTLSVQYFRPLSSASVDSQETPPEALDDEPDSREAWSSDSDAALRKARDHLSAEQPDEAIVAAYGALRGQLQDTYSVPARATHWEFYRSVRRAEMVTESDTELLRQITQRYERAAFAEVAASAETAADTVSAVDERLSLMSKS